MADSDWLEPQEICTPEETQQHTQAHRVTTAGLVASVAAGNYCKQNAANTKHNSANYGVVACCRRVAACLAWPVKP